MNKDRWITYTDTTCKFKTHTITSSLAGSFLANMMVRGMSPKEYEDKSSMEFDTNGGFGSVITSYPKMSFQVGDKTLVLKANVVAETGLSLVTRKAKKLPTGETYHELYHRFHVLVLTEEEVKLLIPQLEEKLVEAREISEAFMENFRKGWNEGMKKYKEEHDREVPYVMVPKSYDNV